MEQKIKTLSCLLVDDNRLSLRLLQALVEQTAFLRLEGAYENSIEAAQVLSEKPIDILFLDVEMPDMTGLELLDTLEQRPQIIITSAKKQYALDAFEYEVVDFLLKPIDNYARFLKAVKRAKSNLSKQQPAPGPAAVTNQSSGQIFLKVDSMLISCELTDILWVEAFGDYVKVATPAKTHVVHAKLRAVEELLPAHSFVRVHRSFIVRIDKIKNIESTNLQIEKTIIPISNSYRRALMDRIQTLSD